MYNSSTWGLTENDRKNLNSFHRKHLRRILNIKFPDKLRNREVYRKTGGKPITLDILAGRWRMLGHVLRLHVETPAHMSMLNYFKTSTQPRFRGRPRVTLPSTLNDDLVKTCSSNDEFLGKYRVNSFRNIADYKKLRVIAGDRKGWKKFTNWFMKLLKQKQEAQKWAKCFRVYSLYIYIGTTIWSDYMKSLPK